MLTCYKRYLMSVLLSVSLVLGQASPESSVAISSKIPKEILRYVPNPIEIAKLSGGAVNQCYRVSCSKGIFAIRIGKPNPENYGFDRYREWQFYKEGERLGISPTLRDGDPSTGTLVMDFIEGPLVDKTLIRHNDGISKVADLLRKLHSISCKEDKEPITLFFVRTFLEKLKFLGLLPEGWEKKIQEIINQTSCSKQLVLCHNDLAFNLMFENDRFWAIDWECAGWNDPLFDLAPLCIWYDFSTEEKKKLLVSYFGELKQEKELDQAIRLVLIFSALWCLLEVGYGEASYQKQAMELFERAASA